MFKQLYHVNHRTMENRARTNITTKAVVTDGVTAFPSGLLLGVNVSVPLLGVTTSGPLLCVEVRAGAICEEQKMHAKVGHIHSQSPQEGVQY